QRRWMPGTSARRRASRFGPGMTAVTFKQTCRPSLPRHHRHALIARLDALRGRGEIQRCAAFVGAAADDRQPVLAGDDVALAQGRIVLDLDLRQPDRILAVAGAAGDELVAVAERVRQLGVTLSIVRRGIVDAAAVDQLGLARRTQAAARGGAALVVGSRDRKMTAIAGAHAKCLTAAVAPSLALLPERPVIAKRHPDHGREPGWIARAPSGLPGPPAMKRGR